MSGTTHAWGWHHTGIAVSDLDEAIAFYEKTLGFEVVFEARGLTDLIESVVGVRGLGADLVQCRSPMSEQHLELLQFKNVPVDCDPRLPIQPGRVHTAYLVTDIERSINALIRAGGVMLGRVTEFSEGRSVYCADRTGAVVELEEAKEPA